MLNLQKKNVVALAAAVALIATGLACGNEPTITPVPTAAPEPSATQTPTTTLVPTATPEGCRMRTDKPIYTTGFALERWARALPLERQILELMHKYADELIRIPGVHGVGYGGGSLCVNIDPDASPADKARIPRKLEGCDVEVFEVGLVEPL
jgi:hypothetical protein